MHRNKLICRLCIFLVSFIAAAASGLGQTVMGQYEDEAPLRTWNTFAFTTAAALGRGDVSFSFASDVGAVFANPALLLTLPGKTATINGSIDRATMFKYGIVNTGVIKTGGNSALNQLVLEFGGASIRLGKWSLGAAMALTESYSRPESKTEEKYQGYTYYRFLFSQSGLLRNLNVSLARSFGERLSVGIGLNYVFGRRDKEINEEWIYWGYSVSDVKNYEFSGIFLNGGASLRLSPHLTAALVFRTPYHLTAKAKSTVRFYSPRAGTDVSIPGNSEDTYDRPPVVGAGLGWQASAEIRLGVDLSWHNWSSYKAQFFDEPSERNFRDIVKINAGGEYLLPLNLWGKKGILPLRIGFVMDPQPMKNPKSVYYFCSLGTGFHWSRFLMDIGAMIGKESGSGNSLTAQRVSVSLTYNY